jgi:hypothetical protein
MFVNDQPKDFFCGGKKIERSEWKLNLGLLTFIRSMMPAIGSFSAKVSFFSNCTQQETRIVKRQTPSIQNYLDCAVESRKLR